MERFTVKFLNDDAEDATYQCPCMAIAASLFAEEEAEVGMIETQDEFDDMPPIEVTDSEGNKKLFRIKIRKEISYIPSEVANDQ
ncbi:hypothetical protein [Maridesulfovibrio ferrireducens]|uniref:hypothetical protein n=1 Tax=Maridesulfovibrio ferrireducens TaxID=246191 RepID=UPI001A360FF1|nr:hypothetical protein [Maridesulfovibrio ferrireducens]MBI9109889.1 hypothetical protein [Maridesulfovibrio ferrireducens]